MTFALGSDVSGFDSPSIGGEPEYAAHSGLLGVELLELRAGSVMDHLGLSGGVHDLACAESRAEGIVEVALDASEFLEALTVGFGKHVCK